MAIYRITDILNQLVQITSDGYDYVDLTSLEANDDFPASLDFSAIDLGGFSIGYNPVESVNIPSDYDPETSERIFFCNDVCSDLLFTYNEILTTRYAIDNVLEFFKAYLKEPSCSGEERDDIKASSVDVRNLQAKLNKFLSHCK